MLLTIQLVPIDYRYLGIGGFAGIAYLLSAFALWDDLKGAEWVTILALPTLFATATGLFYFLLPESTLWRFIIVSGFGISMYAIYLTENIYSVAANRTIQLLRAAHTVGFLVSIVTLIFLYYAILSQQLIFWLNASFVGIATFPVMLQGLWSFSLNHNISVKTLSMSFGIAVVIAQTALILSFLPVTIWVASLFLATMVYIISLGLLQHAYQDRLFTSTINEYVAVGIIVLAITLILTPWR